MRGERDSHEMLTPYQKGQDSHNYTALTLIVDISNAAKTAAARLEGDTLRQDVYRQTKNGLHEREIYLIVHASGR